MKMVIELARRMFFITRGGLMVSGTIDWMDDEGGVQMDKSE